MSQQKRALRQVVSTDRVPLASPSEPAPASSNDLIKERLVTMAAGAFLLVIFVVLGFTVLGHWSLMIATTQPMVYVVVSVVGLLLIGAAVLLPVVVIMERRHKQRMEEKILDTDLHLQKSRLLPDEAGNYPHIWNEKEQRLIPAPKGQYKPNVPQHWAPHEHYEYNNRDTSTRVQEEKPDTLALSGGLPTLVRYEEIKPYIPPNHALVGVDERGVQTRQRDDLKSLIWIVGSSGSGKTNSGGLRVDEDYMWGHYFILIDPHWFKSDSMYHAIKQYEDRFLLPVAYEVEDIINALDYFINEFEQRRSGQSWDYPITIIIDEVGSLTADKPETDEEKLMVEKIKKVARLCGQETRNFEMAGLFLSQDATRLSWLRNRAILVLAHQLLMMNERLLATNQNPEIARQMDTWPKGRTLVYGIGFQEGQRVMQQPVRPRIVEANQQHIPSHRVSRETSLLTAHSFLRENAPKKSFENFDVKAVKAGVEPGESLHQMDEPFTDVVKPSPTISEAERDAILACARTQQDLTGDERVNKTKLIEVLREIDGPKWNNKSREKIRFVLDEAGIPQQ